MLKMMVFSINTSKYFELGCLELEKFIKHLGEPAYANLITDELKEKYIAQLKDKGMLISC